LQHLLQKVFSGDKSLQSSLLNLPLLYLPFFYLLMASLQRVTIATAQLSGQLSDQCLTLTQPQQHYLSRVLRLRGGDRFIAMDGQGHWWLAVLSASLTEAKILEPISAQTELPISVTLLIALPKTGMEEIVRQTTELGVDRIVPILSARTLLNPSAQKRDRWQRIAQEAAEQSERQIVPMLLEPIAWAEALQAWSAGSCYLCAERGDRSHLLDRLQTNRVQTIQDATQPTLTIATGCEGGWTEGEIAAAIAAGYQSVSLGARILRAVTAPVAAMAIVASVYEAHEAIPSKDKAV
jgi:16S rRNA (uracil1498-N3)-methyltransferase